MSTRGKILIFVISTVNMWAAQDSYTNGKIGLFLALLWGVGSALGGGLVIAWFEYSKARDADAEREEERDARFAHERELKRMELDNQQVIELRKTEAERVHQPEGQRP